MRGITALVVSALVVGAFASSVQRTDPPDGSKPVAATVDIKVALKTDKGCKTPFLDSLPTLVSAAELQPGEVTPATVVCLRNQGGAKASASMSVIELVGRDDACTGGESQVDETCGSGLAGELQDVLVQEFVLLDKCTDPVVGFVPVPFAGLAATPLTIGPIGRNDTRCVAIRLRHAQGPGVEAAQTDSVSWRYAFQLTS